MMGVYTDASSHNPLLKRTQTLFFQKIQPVRGFTIMAVQQMNKNVPDAPEIPSRFDITCT